MEIKYCDICYTPLKEKDYYMLYLLPAVEGDKAVDNYSDYYKYLKDVQKKIKEICPTCKNIVDKIFDLRLGGIQIITDEIMELYNLPEKKDGK